jgi:putrescine---pyruvate transaminase
MSAHPSAFWHPFADMSAVAGHDLVIASGHGSRVTSEDGREFLDASAGLWYCNVGHGRREIADAVMQQMTSIAAYSNFGDLATRSTLDLADRLAALAPMPDAKVFFTSGGSDAVDADVANVAWDDAEALAALIDEVGSGSVAAFFCEPVIGAGGVYPPPPGYLEAVRAICRDRGVLFVADEVITGYGRTGRMFASEGLEPDLVLTAKGLTSGYLPMGAVLVAGSVAEPFWHTPGFLWRHGYTYSGHAAAAAAAMANLDIIEGEQLVQRVAGLQLGLTAALVPLRGHEYVVDVRSGAGLLGAVTLDPELLAADPTLMPRVLGGMRERGVLTRGLADGSVQISPAFVITRDELGVIAAAIDEALTAAGSTRAASPSSGSRLLPDVTSDEAGGFGSLDDRLLADVPPHHGG